MAGQSCLMEQHLPIHGWVVVLPSLNIIGLALLVAAIASAAMVARYPRRVADPSERLWRGFRDYYGAMWALRIAQRFNETAAAKGWQRRLKWNGFVSESNPAGAAQTAMESSAAVEQSFRSLLGRFVSPEWIERMTRAA